MAPAGSRYGPNNMSNPFVSYNQNQAHQTSHLQHPSQNFPSQNIGGHPGFANPNLGFFSGTGSTGLAGGFQSGGALGGGGTGLNSHAAQMGFEHGAALQQQQARAAAGGVTAGTKAMSGRVREVWRNNLAEEMELLRHLVDKYTYISMVRPGLQLATIDHASNKDSVQDTEFPGVVARPMGEFQSKASYHYQTVRCNVDLLKIIQLGITLFTPEGDVPPTQIDPSLLPIGYQHGHVVFPCTWQFNFQFSTEDDMYNEESINVLIKSGANFEKHATQGIDPLDFGSLLITSGLAFADDVNWISFHSGYDFAYLVKIMWQQPLPNDETEYRRLVNIFFPRLIDVKFLLRHAHKRAQAGILTQSATNVMTNLGTKSGLQDLAEELGCQRIGTQHTAGSDAWLTGLVFWKMKEKMLDGQIPEELNGEMWGLTGVGPPASSAVQAAALAAQGHVNGGMMGMAFQSGGTSTTHQNAGPSTPTTTSVGLASTTPGPSGHMGTLTPGPFGGYQYNK